MESTSFDILGTKGKVTKNIEKPTNQWYDFLDNEAREEKLNHRVRNEMNRSKKVDIHRLGETYFDNVKGEWAKRTKGTLEEWKESNRVNLYLNARRQNRTNKFPDKLAATLVSFNLVIIYIHVLILLLLQF